MSTDTKPPTALTALGWISTVGGGMMAMSGGMGLLAWASFPADKGPPTPAADAPAALHILATVFQYFGVLCCVQVVFAGFVACAGQQLLKRRAWARAALEGVFWLALCWVIGFGTFWVVLWLQLAARMPADKDAPALSAGLAVFGIVVGVVVMGGLAVATLVVIRIIRSKAVRDALVA